MERLRGWIIKWGVDTMSNEELVFQIQQGIDTANNMELLYMKNKGFIASVVKKYSYVCKVKNSWTSVPIIEFDELMNEAYFGLVEAVNKYDSNQGALFISYAAYWIKQVVKKYIDNCGRVIRVPVHKQEQIYKYNQVSAYYLKKYNRQATTSEYAIYLNVTEKAIDNLEKFMFQKTVISLEAPLPSREDEDITFSDSIGSDIDIENDVVEKVAKEQIKEELWDIVYSVLKNDKMKEVIHHRFIDGLSLDSIGEKMNITRDMVRQYEAKSLRVLRCNSRTKRLGADLGLWGEDNPIDMERVKRWVNISNIDYLDDKELKYAKRMGWIQEQARTRQF